jgi:hypothetical protein
MMRSVCVGVLGILLSLQVCFAQTAPHKPDKGKEKLPSLKVLLIAAVEKRGANFKKFIESNDISCTITDFNKVDDKMMETHDVIITDNIQGHFGEFRDLETQTHTRIKAMPKTGKPIIGIGYSGWFYFKRFDICLGRVKT